MHKFFLHFHGFIEKKWHYQSLLTSGKTFLVWILDVDTTCRLTQISH